MTPPSKAPIGPPNVNPIMAPMAEFQKDIYIFISNYCLNFRII